MIFAMYSFFHYQTEIENNFKHIEVSQEFSDIKNENGKLFLTYRVTNIIEEELQLRFTDYDRHIDINIESEVPVKNVTVFPTHSDNIFSPNETWEYKIEIETGNHLIGEHTIEVRFIPNGIRTLSSISTVWSNE